jgi:hypothetical protein
MTEDKLDREIDLALEEMVAGDGPVDLRRRVLERLAEPPPRVASRGVMLAAAATIALAVATAVVFRGPLTHPPATMNAHRHLPPAAAPIPPPSVSAGPPPPTETARRLGSATWRPAGRPPAPELPVPDDVEADASGIEPIEVSPLAVAPMETQRWAIAPLRIEPMQIEPLAEPQP